MDVVKCIKDLKSVGTAVETIFGAVAASAATTLSSAILPVLSIALLFILLVSSFPGITNVAFASGEPQVLDSQVVLLPENDAGTIMRAAVLVFEPAVSRSGVDIRTIMDQIREQCRQTQPNDVVGCMQQVSSERTSGSQDYALNLISLENAHVRFTYYDPVTSAYLTVPNCGDLVTDPNNPIAPSSATPQQGTLTAGVIPTSTSYYVARCPIPESVYQGQLRTQIRVIFDPAGRQVNGNDVRAAYAEFTIDNAHVSAGDVFSGQISRFIANMAEGSGYGGNGDPLPCLGVFLILGLLFATVYFSGKSPLSLLDITTPKLPQPKGVTASGQIVTPFGYSEMKSVTRQQMAAAAAAANIAAEHWRKPGDSFLARASTSIGSIQGTRADMLDPRGFAAVKNMGNVLTAAGRHVGMSAQDLEPLLHRHPGQYGTREHEVVAEILRRLEARGGADAMRARTIDHWFIHSKMARTLAGITAELDANEAKSYARMRVLKSVNAAFGTARWGAVSGLNASTAVGLSSMMRSMDAMRDYAGRAVQTAPDLARQIGKAGVKMVGGRHALDDLEARSRTSATAAWLNKQLTLPPQHQRVMGKKAPLPELLTNLYETHRREAIESVNIHYLAQIYRKAFGVHFGRLTDEDVLRVCLKGGSILHESGFAAALADPVKAAKIAALEAKLHEIFSSATMTMYEKSNALHDLAVEYTRQVDPHAIDQRAFALVEKIHTLDLRTDQPEYAKALALEGMIKNAWNESLALSRGARGEDAFMCFAGGGTMHDGNLVTFEVMRDFLWNVERGYKTSMRDATVFRELEFGELYRSSVPTKRMDMLPEQFRNKATLERLEKQAVEAWCSLATAEGHAQFQKANNKRMENASMAEIVDFLHYKHIAGKETTSGNPYGFERTELKAPTGAMRLDPNRWWTTGYEPNRIKAVAHFVEDRWEGGAHHTPYELGKFSSEMEARLDKLGLTGDARRARAKELWMMHEFVELLNTQANGLYGHSTYGGAAHSNLVSYGGMLSGTLQRVLREQHVARNHEDRVFLERMDLGNPHDLARLNELMLKYRTHFEAYLKKDVRLNDLVERPMVQDAAGFYYDIDKKTVVSSRDRIAGNGVVVLRDDKGNPVEFNAAEAHVRFNRPDLDARFQELMANHEKNPMKWAGFMDAAERWSREGVSNFDRRKVYAGLCHQYGDATGDYTRMKFEIVARHEASDTAPFPLRAIGIQTWAPMKPIREFADAVGHWAMNIFSHGPMHKRSYDVSFKIWEGMTASHRQAELVASGEGLVGMSAREQAAQRAIASNQGRFYDFANWTTDRAGVSTSHGSEKVFEDRFNAGMSMPGPLWKQYLGGAMPHWYQRMQFWLYTMWTEPARLLQRQFLPGARQLQQNMVGTPMIHDINDGNLLRTSRMTGPRFLEGIRGLVARDTYDASNGRFLGWINRAGEALNVTPSTAVRRHMQGPVIRTGLYPSTLLYSRVQYYDDAREGLQNPGLTMQNARRETLRAAKAANNLLEDPFYAAKDSVRRDAYTRMYKAGITAEDGNSLVGGVTPAALHHQRMQELRGVNIWQLSQGMFLSPIATAWHTLIKEPAGKLVAAMRYGSPISPVGNMKDKARRAGLTMQDIFMPQRGARLVECGRCHTKQYLGRGRCTACGATI